MSRVQLEVEGVRKFRTRRGRDCTLLDGLTDIQISPTLARPLATKRMPAKSKAASGKQKTCRLR